MVGVEVLHKQLEKLAEYLPCLKKLQGSWEEEFIGDPQSYGATER